MSIVLTFVTQEDGALTKLAAETATFARQLSEAAGAELHAALIGQAGDAAAASLRSQGVATIHQVVDARLDEFAPAAWAASLVQLHGDLDVHAIIGPGDDRGGEVMAHLAAQLDQPLAANCTAVFPADDGWELTRVRWGGVLLEDARLSADVALLTAAPHQTAAADATSPGAAEISSFTPQLADDLFVGKVTEIATRSGGVSLATAPVVISGGRGVGSAEAFEPLEELAGLLGGAVGCSRVATNNGWRSHNDQVGQTGTRVAPDLYVACGISGATQHWVGCMSSKRILAINTDAEAPMVTRADYAVLGDLHELLPAVIERVKARKGVG